MAAVLAQAGCVTAEFKEPITAFQTSVDESEAVVRTYFTELNDFERQLYLESVLNADPKDSISEVLATTPDGHPTPLIGATFSVESIRARTDAVALVGAYARRLAELAGSEAPTKFESAAQALGSNLGELPNTFRALEGKDATAKNYSGPIGSIVGTLGKMYVEAKRDASIKDAIGVAAPHVRTVLQLLQNDLASVVGPLRLTGLKQMLAERVTAYNSGRATLPRNERAAMLADIRAAARQYEIAIAFDPRALIEGISLAHDKLVEYAASDRNPQSLAELVTAMEALHRRIAPIAAAIKEMRDLGSANK